MPEDESKRAKKSWLSWRNKRCNTYPKFIRIVTKTKDFPGSQSRYGSRVQVAFFVYSFLVFLPGSMVLMGRFPMFL